ncbi:MAG: hypothetical protein FWD05_05305, partial [Oscillospiraceae bacterium]|nr:hypothetical protein [Oscillospiraceae bacterium]
MKRFKMSLTSKKRLISLIMTISLIVGLFGMVATALGNDYDTAVAYDDVYANVERAAPESEQVDEPQSEEPAAETDEPEYVAYPEEEAEQKDEANAESDSYAYNEEDTYYNEYDEEYEYAEYDIITIAVIERLDGDVDVTVLPYGTEYVYNVEEDEEGNLEVAITFPPSTEGDIEKENVRVPSAWDFDIETDLSGYTTVTVLGFVPLLDFNVGTLAELRALMESGQVQDGDAITLSAVIVIPEGDSLNLEFGGANVTILVNGTHRHFDVRGILYLQDGVTLRGNRPDNFTWPVWSQTTYVADLRAIMNATAPITVWPNGGGVILNHADATVEMNSGSIISGSRGTAHGVGVRVVQGTFNMNGGVIEDNFSTAGGAGVGVVGHNNGSSTFRMYVNAIIRNNVSTGAGAGVHGTTSFEQDASNIYVFGGLIQGNVAGGAGGGVRIYANTNFYLLDAQIVGNKTHGTGGGLSIVQGPDSHITLTIRGGTISGNERLNPENTTSSGVVLTQYSWDRLATGSYENLVLVGNNDLRIDDGPVGGRRHVLIWGDGTRVYSYPYFSAIFRDYETGIITFRPASVLINENAGFPYPGRPIDYVEITLPNGTEVTAPGGGTVEYTPPGNWRLYDADGVLIGGSDFVSPDEPGDPWTPNTTGSIVRGILINIWGETNLSQGQGLLRANGVTGVEIPQVLFDIVEADAPGWTAWFMQHRVWGPALPASQVVTPMRAAVAFSASNLPWNDAGRVTDLDHFFSYLEAIINRAVYRFEATGQLGYLAGIEAGITDTVIGFAV